MSGEHLVKLALKNLACTQKELAKKLGVSPAQISKWKAGEHISFEMEEQLSREAGIGDRHPEVVVWTGGIEQADKWEKLVALLADFAYENDETGYITEPLVNEGRKLLCWHTLYSMRQLGVVIPEDFPVELDLKDEYTEEEFDTVFYVNPYSKLIYASYRALTDIYGFYAAYISEVVFDDDMELFDTGVENIEPCLLELAFSKVGENSSFMPNFSDFKYRTMKNYQKWIEIVKKHAFQKGTPIKAELMNLVSVDHEMLGHEAEAEALGFNANRLHPDIYMNEILQSQRVIHQVLPAICKKLGITEDELQIDSLELYIK